MAANKVQTYDTTLRDGSQGEGVSFSLQDKLNLAKAFDCMGIDFIEGGWPGSNPKDAEFFAQAKSLKFKHSRLAAFGSTRHAKNTPGTDPNLKHLVSAKVPVVTIFGKSWDLHVREALRVGLDVNLKMIESSIKYLSSRVDTAFFDGEHFFDGYRDHPEYALKSLEAAVNGGAAGLILCDTNGGSLPEYISKVTAKVVESFPGVTVGIHCHNDCGLATANSVAAVQSGATQVQGTMNGFGERAGNADLTQIIPILELKMGRKCIGSAKLRHLTEFSRYVYETANTSARDAQPFVGRSAFAHKAGIHVSAMARNEKTYEHISPEAVGNERRVLVSELSGRSNLKALKIKELDDDPTLMKKVLEEVMRRENEGYAYENAGGSFTVLVHKLAGVYVPRFKLLSYRVGSEIKHDYKDWISFSAQTVSESTVKVQIGDKLLHTVAEGEHGPVDALGRALRKALLGYLPELKNFRLSDYKVHIVNAQAGTSAKVRVVVQCTDGVKVWGTVGVSENIIEASCHALLDAVDYLLLQCGRDKVSARGKNNV